MHRTFKEKLNDFLKHIHNNNNNDILLDKHSFGYTT